MVSLSIERKMEVSTKNKPFIPLMRLRRERIWVQSTVVKESTSVTLFLYIFIQLFQDSSGSRRRRNLARLTRLPPADNRANKI